MPIESRIPTEEIDIKHLQIEQPEGTPVGLSFELNEEISKENFDLMVADLEDWKQENPDIYLHFLSELKILYPKLELHLDEKMWEEMVAKLENDKQDSYKGFASDAADIKALFPEQFRQRGVGNFDLQTLRVRLLKLRENFLASPGSGEANDYLDQARPLKTIAPEFANLFVADEEMKKLLLNPSELNKWKKESMGSFTDFAASIKVLYPGLTAKQLQIANKDWEGMLRDFRELIAAAKRGSTFWPHVASRARNLQILAAPELRFTDKGIETGPEKKVNLTDQIKPLPEVKKF